MVHPLFKFSERITCLPVIHGSGEFALQVRRTMMDDRFDCVAIPLPPSFKQDVETAVVHLPAITMVTQAEGASYSEPGHAEDDLATHSFVPIDPCQPVIAAIRGAM